MTGRVLHVIPSISPRRGGPSTAILAMVRALLDHGVDAEIATTNDDGDTLLDIPTHQPVDLDGIPVRFFPRFSPSCRQLREFAYSGPFRDWLAANLGDYAIVHTHALFSYLPSATMRAARRLRVPYVSRPLGQLGRWPLRQSAWRKRLYLALGEACHLRAASALHFTSEAERAEAAALGFHGEIIPHGIDLPRLVPRAAQRLRARFAIPPENKIVLFLGRLHPKKGLDLLLPAFAKLAAPAATLILAGDGDVAYLAELRQLSHQLNLTEKIRWVGFVNGEEKALLLQGSDLFVLPSRHENFGLAVLEALAAGTPVLISDQVALTSEIAHSHVGEVISLDPIALTGALARLLALPPQRDYNRAFVAEHYSWQRTAATLTELYASLCPGLLSPA